LALLAALGDGVEGNALAESAGDAPLSSTKNGVDVSSLSAADAAAVVAWQGLLDPTQSQTKPSAVYGQSALAASQSANSFSGSIAAVAQSATQGLAVSSGNAPNGNQGLVISSGNAPNGNQGLVISSGNAPNGNQGLVISPGNALNDLLLPGMPQGLVAETAKLDTSADLKEQPSQGTLGGFGRAFSLMQAANAQRVIGMGGAEVSLGAVASKDATGRANTVHGSSSALLASTAERGLMGVPAGTTMERSGVAQSSSVVGMEVAAPLADSVVAMVGSAQAAESPAGARSHGNGEHAGTTGAWFEGVSGPSPSDVGSFTDATALADLNALGAEEQVAEQVAYWVNQKTQNAELTLQRDGHPVEVSLSLSGNEAHVSFRSDQQQTRELLDQSMAQLSDLLRSEGLVLSGMSVGTSARDSDGGREAGQQRPREGARQAQVVSAVPAGAASLARGGGTLDRAVDVFV
jgi:flagellar hook-length control protein FliK